jgi:hypothetical protein
MVERYLLRSVIRPLQELKTEFKKVKKASQNQSTSEHDTPPNGNDNGGT